MPTQQPQQPVEEPLNANVLMGLLGNESPKDEDFKLTKTEYIAMTKLLKTISGTGAPTHYPKNFFEQFYFQLDGTTYLLWIYMNNVWKSFPTTGVTDQFTVSGHTYYITNGVITSIV